jgi:TRAP-type transport system periplasmic protein
MRRAFLALLLSLPFAATAQQITKLKYAEFSPDRERIHNTVTKEFAAAVEKASLGAVKVELFPNGALGRNPAQQAQLVQDGVADIAFIVPSFTPGRYPDSEVMTLPGLFRDLREATLVFTRLVMSGKIKDYEQYVPIATWTTPPFSIHAAFPISSAADLKGKKIRASGTMQSDILRALGAVPVAIPPTEVPEAIARRTIDAATSQPAVVYDFGYNRVTSNHYFIQLGVTPLVVLMNKSKFESMPPVAQDAIRAHSMQWMANLYIDQITAYDRELVKKLQDDPKRHVVFPGSADEQATNAAFQRVTSDWINRSSHNAELFKAATAELEKVRAGE